MKKLFVLLFVGLCFISNAQTVTYQDILEQKPAKELTGRKGGDDITAYVASDGVTYKIGSTITYGYPTNGKYYLYFKDVTGSWLNVLAEDEKASASDRAVSQERAERIENRAGGLACTNFEEAIATKEVVVKANLDDMASDAALQELKKWKEKLDLQIITQEEYDAKKAELMKKIK